MVDLGECRPLHARISARQCGINRQRGMISCEKCDGLVNGKLVSEEKLMATNKKKGTCVNAKVPTRSFSRKASAIPAVMGAARI